jgi:hypothetical protein
MVFENDVFISYAHIDDVALIEGQKGWITNFHRALEIRLAQLLGRQPRIWRDPKLSGNDVFADRLVDRLPGVAILVSIVSPRYLKSDWCLRELREFITAANQTGGIRIGHKVRVFKIVKTPVPLEQQVPELQHMLGYEFFTADPTTGRPKELSQGADADVQRLYWAKLDDLAHDLVELIETLEGTRGTVPVASSAAAATSIVPVSPGVPGSPASLAIGNPLADKAVYLAETTYDLREKRDAIRRELLVQGLTVLPASPLPHVVDECEQAIRDNLAQTMLSIHLIGRNYGLIPEGATESTIVIQNEMAIARAAAGDYPRLIWIPEKLDSVEDERQLRFIEHLQTDTRIQRGADILQTPFEEFKAALTRRLTEIEEREKEKAAAAAKEAARLAREAAKDADTEAEPHPPSPAQAGGGSGDQLTRIYLISDRRDEAAPTALADYLYDQGFEVILPVFEGEEAQIRKDHEENLSVCDAVLFYYGEGNELWLRQKLREVQKSAAFGRKKPIVIKAIYVAPPDSPSKARFKTREAMVIDQRAPFDPVALTDFISQLHG